MRLGTHKRLIHSYDAINNATYFDEESDKYLHLFLSNDADRYKWRNHLILLTFRYAGASYEIIVIFKTTLVSANFTFVIRLCKSKSCMKVVDKKWAMLQPVEVPCVPRRKTVITWLFLFW